MTGLDTADLEARLHRTFADQARALHPTDRHWGDYVTRQATATTSRRRWLAVAAAAVLLAASGFVLVTLRHGTTTGAAASSPRIAWSTSYVELTADHLTIDVGGQRFAGGDPAVELNSDPGDATYETLEMVWHEHGVEMRINVYFAADATHWWVTEVRTYNGKTGADADWVTFPGERLRTPLGVAYDGDLDLTATEHDVTSHLHLTGLHLLPFRISCSPPAPCPPGGPGPESATATAVPASTLPPVTAKNPPG